MDPTGDITDLPLSAGGAERGISTWRNQSNPLCNGTGFSFIDAVAAILPIGTFIY